MAANRRGTPGSRWNSAELTLSDAITRFDTSVLPWFGLPRTLPAERLPLLHVPHGESWS